MIDIKNNIPATGLAGFIKHFKDDFKAAISVALVALPLGLGIALASGAPPMAGLIPPIIAGLFTTFVRTSHLSINGPSAGLIVVVLTGIQTLGGFEFVLAAIIVSGFIQVILGILRMGKLGNYFPASVVQGMLAAIGIIIIASQLHVGLGVEFTATSAIESILEVPVSLAGMNPYVTFITAVSLVILVSYPKINSAIIKAVPAALWVLIFTIPLVFLYDSVESGLFDKSNLIHIPDNILDSIMYPDFSKLDSIHFWATVIAITFISSIETIISTKAIEKLDTFKRKTNQNQDLIAVGLSTMISGFIGGLPVITVIVRSSVNINNEASTKWSNFHHGVLILLFVLLLPNIINMIPTAALSGILIYAGYRLAAPKVFRDVYIKGWEQLIIMVVTLGTTLFTNGGF